MIRLVTCDIDGTLLHGEETSIDAETLEEIRRLREKGILFCPASGRQYHSLRRLFAPVQDEIAYICENGSVVFGPGNPGPVWGKVPLERNLAVQLCRDIMAMPECEINASGENTCYVCTRDEEYLHHMREDVGNITEVVDDPDDIPETIIKVSAFSRRGTGAVTRTRRAAAARGSPPPAALRRLPGNRHRAGPNRPAGAPGERCAAGCGAGPG